MANNMYQLSRSTAQNVAFTAEQMIKSEGLRGVQRIREFRVGADQDYVDRLSELWGASYKLPSIDANVYPSVGFILWAAKVPGNRSRRITERRVPAPPTMLHRYVDSSPDRVAQGMDRGERAIEEVVKEGGDPIRAISEMSQKVDEAMKNRSMATVQYRVAAEYRYQLGIMWVAEALGISTKSLHRFGSTPVLKGFGE